SLVLADHRGDPVREREIRLRPLLHHDLGDRAFVFRPYEGPEEAHREGLDTCCLEAAEGGAYPVFIQWDQHLAGRVDPLGDLDDYLTVDQRLRVPATAVVPGRRAHADPRGHAALDQEGIPES